MEEGPEGGCLGWPLGLYGPLVFGGALDFGVMPFALWGPLSFLSAGNPEGPGSPFNVGWENTLLVDPNPD